MHKLLLTAGLLFISVIVQAENLYYIYKDDKGRTFIEDSITANHAKYGYRVMNSQGTTLRTVPGTMEKESRERKRLAKKESSHKKALKRSQDEFLIRTFVDEDDIRETGNKKILAIQSQIDTTLQHIEAFENNLIQLEEQVTMMDRAGQPITDQQVDDIRRIKNSIEQNKAFVNRKIQQQEDVRTEYLSYIKRFRALKSQH